MEMLKILLASAIILLALQGSINGSAIDSDKSSSTIASLPHDVPITVKAFVNESILEETPKITEEENREADSKLEAHTATISETSLIVAIGETTSSLITTTEANVEEAVTLPLVEQSRQNSQDMSPAKFVVANAENDVKSTDASPSLKGPVETVSLSLSLNSTTSAEVEGLSTSQPGEAEKGPPLSEKLAESDAKDNTKQEANKTDIVVETVPLQTPITKTNEKLPSKVELAWATTETEKPIEESTKDREDLDNDERRQNQDGEKASDSSVAISVSFASLLVILIACPF